MRLSLLVILGFIIYLNYSHLFYLNVITHSLPHGIYIRTSGTSKIGDYAVTCLTPEIAKYGIDRGIFPVVIAIRELSLSLKSFMVCQEIIF